MLIYMGDVIDKGSTFECYEIRFAGCLGPLTDEALGVTRAFSILADSRK